MDRHAQFIINTWTTGKLKQQHKMHISHAIKAIFVRCAKSINWVENRLSESVAKLVWDNKIKRFYYQFAWSVFCFKLDLTFPSNARQQQPFKSKPFNSPLTSSRIPFSHLFVLTSASGTFSTHVVFFFIRFLAIYIQWYNCCGGSYHTPNGANIFLPWYCVNIG